MANTPEPPWHPSEKTWLLAELIKHSNAHPTMLVNFIRSSPLQLPSLDEIPLPSGRSLKSCRAVYQELMQPAVHHSHPAHLLQPMQSQPPQATTSMAGPSYRPPYPQGPGGPVYPVAQGGRLIRPKTSTPAFPNGQPMPGNEPPPKRKRGRPTKAEQQRKADAAAASSIEPGPSRPPPVITTAILQPAPPASIAAPVDESKTAMTPSKKVSIAAMLGTTPVSSKDGSTSSHSGSSSGKRRKARQKAIGAGEEGIEYRADPGRAGYASPYPGPALATVEETPTPAPVVRRHFQEGPAPSHSPQRSPLRSPSRPDHQASRGPDVPR